MEKILKTITKALSTVVVALVVVLAVLLAGVRVLGLTPYTVLSGSMEPTYPVGAIIYVSKVDPTELEVGDPLTYRLTGDTIATHRIVEVLNPGTAELAFRTKGDANEHPDGSPVEASRVIGKPLFHVPYLGFVSAFVQKPMGLVCVVGCGAAVLVLSTLVEALLRKPEDEPDPEKEGAQEEADNG